MPEVSDMELLRVYDRQGSEEAFAELVRRHINLVYSAALRHVGIAAHAAEITQTVFIILVRKAAGLRPDTVLEGWLYETTRLTSLSFLRGERRRQLREQEAYMQSTLQESSDALVWNQLSPLLDEAMSRLGKKDREAVVLRYFKDKNLREVAAVLKVTESAAQRRVHRAVEKLRTFFMKRGVSSTAAIIAGTISANAVQAAPAGMAAKVIAVAAVKGGLVSASTLTLIKGTLKLMAWTKLKTAAVVGVGVLLATGTTTVTVKEIHKRHDSARAQVLAIIQTNDWEQAWNSPGLDKLVAMGPKALPCLSELIQWKDTMWNRELEKLWPSLPPILSEQLQDPSVWPKMQRNAVRAVNLLGPAAARPLSGALCKSLNNSDWKYDAGWDLGGLYWSIPESPKAVAALTKFLAKPSQAFGIFGSMESLELWPKLPQTMPLLIPWLSNLYAVSDVARALGKMGTNAAPALPVLIEVCDHGIAGTPLKLKGHTSGYPPNEPYLMNRRWAYEALGEIGIASPKVLDALNRGLEDSDYNVQLAALRGLVLLRQHTQEDLGELLEHFSFRKSFSTSQFIGQLGELGTNGQSALPWLRKITSLDYVEKLPGFPERNFPKPISNQQIQSAAIYTIIRINPVEIRDFVSFMNYGPVFPPDMKQIQAASKTSTVAIVSVFEPLLEDSKIMRRIMAADVVLMFAPDNQKARKALRKIMAEGELKDRVASAHLLWKHTGEFEEVLPVLKEGLMAEGSMAEDSFNRQAAANHLAEMGPSARPAVPALKAALWHKDRFFRKSAGKALRKVAPEEMPAIH